MHVVKNAAVQSLGLTQTPPVPAQAHYQPLESRSGVTLFGHKHTSHPKQLFKGI